MKVCLFNLIICHSEGVGERTEKTILLRRLIITQVGGFVEGQFHDQGCHGRGN